MLFRQLFDRESCTYTYLLADPQLREAVIIDPVLELVERDLSLLRELNLRLRFILETHVHADHVTGAAALRAATGAALVGSRAGGAAVDRAVVDGDAIDFGRQSLEVRATPGHTAGCVTYVTHDRRMAFTGDAIFVRGCGRTDFQGGSAQTLYRSIRDKVFSLPDETLIYPGHDYSGRTVSTVAEERRFNPRLGGGITEEAFVAKMAGLGLPYPKRMDEAVPANLQAGAGGASPTPLLAWAPVRRSAVGVPEVDVGWLAQHRGSVRVLDVREGEEITGPLGRLPEAEWVPRASVPAVAEGWDREAPLVLVCRSGGRSGAVALDLERAGFTRVASLAGGMLGWSERVHEQG